MSQETIPKPLPSQVGQSVAVNLALVAGELRAANRLEALRQLSEAAAAAQDGTTPEELKHLVDELMSWAYQEES